MVTALMSAGCTTSPNVEGSQPTRNGTVPPPPELAVAKTEAFLTRIEAGNHTGDCKDGAAYIEGLRVPVNLSAPALAPLFDAADVWARRTCNWVRVTSANDHEHVTNSLHYQGRAVDFMASDLDSLNEWLNRLGYRTLYKIPGHYGHIHAELVPASGFSY